MKSLTEFSVKQRLSFSEMTIYDKYDLLMPSQFDITDRPRMQYKNQFANLCSFIYLS